MDNSIGRSEIVLKHLGFLLTEYNMQFKAQKFNVYGYISSYTYSFYNNNGCFTIRNIPQRDDTGWYVSGVFSEDENELLEKHIIQGLYIQGQYWLWGTGIKRLAASIRSQIAASGDFFGIKVEK
jgi:hypothetical protein